MNTDNYPQTISINFKTDLLVTQVRHHILGLGYGAQRHFQQYVRYIVEFVVEETGVPGENRRSAASH
jgi:hypothetical protein